MSRSSMMWSKHYMRAGAALLVLVSAAGLEYYLANISLPVDAPSRVAAQGEREVLVIEQPDLRSSGDLVLAHSGRRGEVIDAYFENAVFTDQTLYLFSSLGLAPPASLGPVDYVTKPQHPGIEECRTSVRVSLARPMQPGSRLTFFQPQADDTERHRYLGINAPDVPLAVEMNTIAPPGDHAALLPACSVMLRAGNWSQSLRGSVPITILVPQDSRFRFHFESLIASESPWGGTDSLFEPFTLGSIARPLLARGLRIDPAHGHSGFASLPSRLTVQAASEQSLLEIDHLKVGPLEIQTSVSGKGWVTVDGKKITVNLLDRIFKYPIPAALLGAANAAILTWFWRLVSGGKKGQKTEMVGAVAKPRRRHVA